MRELAKALPKLHGFSFKQLDGRISLLVAPLQRVAQFKMQCEKAEMAPEQLKGLQVGAVAVVFL